MRLLVLGGTAFVGRTVVTAAVDRGWSVSTFNRGRGSWAHPAVERITGDRLVAGDLARLAGGRGSRWDAVLDTWAGAPHVVRDSADLLAGRAGRYLYVSSRAVYAPPLPAGLDESHPTVEASPDAESTGYARDKRGAELAVEAAFGDRAVLARAGVILGPLEDVGRLPSWLLRIARGGQVLVPGPADQTLRYLDVRDLAAWLLDAAETGSPAAGGVSGPVNLVNPPGHATTRGLLAAAVAATGSKAELVWADPSDGAAVGVNWQTDPPAWPPAATTDSAGLLATTIDRALASGLRCRPVEQTVADTWAWLLAAQPGPAHVPPSPHPLLGLDPATEQALLAACRPS